MLNTCDFFEALQMQFLLYKFWSAATCRRFGLWHLSPLLMKSFDSGGRDRSRPTKALTGQRTPKVACPTFSFLVEEYAASPTS